jgi:hypothetical protein
MALPPPEPPIETGGDVLVYCYTFAPGRPNDWAERVGCSSASLQLAAGNALADAAARTGIAELRGSLRVGEPIPATNSAIVPITWDLPSLGCLDGELRMSAVGSGITQISLQASYPANGATPTDRHAIVEYAAKALVDQVPIVAERALPAGSGASAPIVARAEGLPAGA